MAFSLSGGAPSIESLYGKTIEAPQALKRVPKAREWRRRRRRWGGVWEGVSPAQPTRGSGEPRKLPQRGLGRSPRH